MISAAGSSVSALQVQEKVLDTILDILKYPAVWSAARQNSLSVRAKINSQIFSVEAPTWQGAIVQEYQAYSELSQRSQVGCIGAKNVKLFLREPLVSTR